MKHCLLLTIFIALFASCDRPECVVENEMFKNNAPNTQVYKQELAKMIDSLGKDAFSYWIAGYSKKSDVEYMHVHIQNENVCAIMLLDITNIDDDLQQFKRVAGRSYRGAGLDGLEFETIKSDSSVSFKYRSVTWIVD